MNDRIHELLKQLRAIEDELQTTLHEQDAKVRYRFQGKRVEFEQGVRAAHARLRIGLLKWLCSLQPRHVLSIPFIYSLFVPLLIFDAFLSLYHSFCFRLYGIPLVRRRDYIVVDRHQLAYLNVVEKLNCVYCGYANGLLAYAREIGARTEQYWCPIKHARKVAGNHDRYAGFMAYGQGEGYQEGLLRLRSELSEGEESIPAATPACDAKSAAHEGTASTQREGVMAPSDGLLVRAKQTEFEAAVADELDKR